MIRSRGWPALVTIGIVVVGCGSPPEHVVIGYALPPWGTRVVPLVEREIREAADAASVRVVFAPVPPPSGAATRVAVAGAGALGQAQRLVQVPDLVAVVGHGGSRESLIAAAVYNDARVVQLVPTGTSRTLRAVGSWTYMLPPDDSLEGDFIAEYLVSRVGAERVAIFFTNDEYGTGLRDGVLQGLERRGVAVVASVPAAWLPPNGAEVPPVDFDALVGAVLRRSPLDAVVVAGRPREVHAIAAVLDRRGLRIPVVAGDGAYIRSEIVGADLAYPTISVVGFWHPSFRDSLSRRFVLAFRALYGTDPDASNALAYDALRLLATAVEESGPHPDAIRRYLRSLGTSRPAFPGVTGPVVVRGPRRTTLVMGRVTEDDVLVAWP